MAQKTTRRLALIMSAAFAVTLGGTASGTPSSGISSTVHLARATIEESVNVNSDGIRFKTKQPTDISVVTLSMAPGATTGWHRHPGIVMIAVTEGTGTFYGADCRSATYSAGDVFVETGADSAAVVRNETDRPFVITVTFVVPRGAPLRIDEPNPGCLGVE